MKDPVIKNSGLKNNTAESKYRSLPVDDNNPDRTRVRAAHAARRCRTVRAEKAYALLLLLFVLVFSGFCGRRVVNAAASGSDQPPVEKYYTSIQIREGDTLWSLAKEYGAGSGRDTVDYIRELQQINRLSGDTILAGNYLTVIYYK